MTQNREDMNQQDNHVGDALQKNMSKAVNYVGNAIENAANTTRDATQNLVKQVTDKNHRK